MFVNKRSSGKILIWVFGLIGLILGCTAYSESLPLIQRITDNGDGKWELLGKRAAAEAVKMIENQADISSENGFIILTNAGYVSINGESAAAALDGLSQAAGVSRGSNTLIEIHTAVWTPLWFAIFEPGSGFCVYLELKKENTVSFADLRDKPFKEICKIRCVQNIDSAYIFSNAAEYQSFFDDQLFGGNEFRIIAVANAAAAGLPGYVLRAIEFHDHFCPGIISGIMMAGFLNENFVPCPSGEYFIHSIDPWCKEDALLTLTNATPGKKTYAVDYPTEAEKASWPKELQNASTLVYRRSSADDKWTCMVLAYEEPDIQIPNFGNDVIEKLYQDIWFLDHLEEHEKFIKIIKEFELPPSFIPMHQASQENWFLRFPVPLRKSEKHS